MAVTDKQVQLLMKQYEKSGSQEQAAAKAGMTRQTASKYLNGAEVPSESKKKTRTWRTRKDPLAEVWDTAKAMLDVTPELESKSLFEYICEAQSTDLQESNLRTFQRRTRAWRATRGPEKEVFFQQKSIPGKRMSLDFTHMDALEITISGVKFNHMLCHCTLSFSNWEWATVCFTENFLALKTGLQEALFRLGHVPEEIWTDNSTSATHKPSKADTESRRFNKKYIDLTEHFGIKPQTINIGKSNENGCVESLNGHIKRRVNQHLLLRGSRDFASRKEYEIFLRGVLNKANDLRRARLREELKSMPELKNTINNTIYTYRVTWSEEDSEYVGLCIEFPSLSWLAATPETTLRGIRRVVADVVADMKASGEAVPEPLATRKFSGKFMIRPP